MIENFPAAAQTHGQVGFQALITKQKPFSSPVISHNLASKAMAAGAFNFAPDTENDATSDKLLSNVTDAVILLTSSSSVKQKIDKESCIIPFSSKAARSM